MKKFYLLYFLIIIITVALSSTLNAQSHEVDSLQRTMKKSMSDSIRCIQYLHLSTAYTQFNPDSAYKLALSAYALAQKRSIMDPQKHMTMDLLSKDQLLT